MARSWSDIRTNLYANLAVRYIEMYRILGSCDELRCGPFKDRVVYLAFGHTPRNVYRTTIGCISDPQISIYLEPRSGPYTARQTHSSWSDQKVDKRPDLGLIYSSIYSSIYNSTSTQILVRPKARQTYRSWSGQKLDIRLDKHTALGS
jgi:hypothetical protein